MPREAWLVAGVGIWMATWWSTEAIPVAATAFIPLVSFPLLQVMPVKAVAQAMRIPLFSSLWARLCWHSLLKSGRCIAESHSPSLQNRNRWTQTDLGLYGGRSATVYVDDQYLHGHDATADCCISSRDGGREIGRRFNVRQTSLSSGFVACSRLRHDH